MLVDGVVPGQVQQRTIALVGGAGQSLSDPVAQLDEELQFALAVAGRLDGLVPPLHQPLRLGERTCLLDVGGRGEEEHLGRDVLGSQITGGDFGAVFPPGGRLDHVEVADHQPLQVRHTHALHSAVGRSDRRVLAQHEVAFDLVFEHCHHGLVGAVRAGQPRQVVVSPVVVRAGGVTPPSLEQADHVGVGVGPETLLLLRSDRIQVIPEGVVDAGLGIGR